MLGGVLNFFMGRSNKENDALTRGQLPEEMRIPSRGYVVLAFFVVVIFVSTYWAYRAIAEKMIKSEYDLLSGIAQQKSDAINELINERHGDAEVFISRPSVWRTLSRINITDESVRLTKAISDTIKAYKYKRILVIDVDLNIIAPMNTSPLQPTERSALREAVVGKKEWLSTYTTMPKGLLFMA